ANTFQALWSVAKTMMSNLLNAVVSNIKQVPANVKNFMNQAVNVIKGINLAQVGRDMMQGLINGIKAMGSKVAGAIGNVVNSAVSSAKKLLGIKSPSRVFRQIGDDTGEGLVLGLKDKETDVVKASKRLSNGVIDGYSASINTNFSKSRSSDLNSLQNGNLNLNIENFNNNREQDVKELVEEIAFYLRRKNIAIGGV
ncbi:MAG: hypothetical protein J6D12_06315, partial [Peptostreptococcaceae bacterium]|nr:hypothetical protein [Peptostreptococcaceae bacterium]